MWWLVVSLGRLCKAVASTGPSTQRRPGPGPGFARQLMARVVSQVEDRSSPRLTLLSRSRASAHSAHAFVLPERAVHDQAGPLPGALAPRSEHEPRLRPRTGPRSKACARAPGGAYTIERNSHIEAANGLRVASCAAPRCQPATSEDSRSPRPKGGSHRCACAPDPTGSGGCERYGSTSSSR